MTGTVPTPDALEHFAATARAEGRALVVGALIVDGRGRLFVQKRAPDRVLFPGCWDIVGGHAEAGEGVEEALAREVREETGWRLSRLGPVVETLDWEAGGEKKREIDLLARVEGDLARPRLEPRKHPEARWLEPRELPLLLEHRDPEDRFIHDLAARAFALLEEAGPDPAQGSSWMACRR